MENIHVVARFKIHEGQLQKFKSGTKDCIAATKNETGALLYDWFIDENAMICTVIETYKDSNAVLAHAGNASEPLSKLMEISELVVEVFGNTSVELQNALKEMNVTPVPFFGGL